MAHTSLPGDVSTWSRQSVWCQPAGQHSGSRPLTPLAPTSPHSDVLGLLVSLCVTTERDGHPFLAWPRSPETQKPTESSPTPGCLCPSLPSANCPPLGGVGRVEHRTGSRPREGHRRHGGATRQVCAALVLPGPSKRKTLFTLQGVWPSRNPGDTSWTFGDTTADSVLSGARSQTLPLAHTRDPSGRRAEVTAA